MNILHRDARSILPRVESLHLISRSVILAGIVSYLIFATIPENRLLPLLLIGAVQVVLLTLSLVLSRRSGGGGSVNYFVNIALDTVLFALLTSYTGGLASDFYLYYFLSVSLGAYIMSSSSILIYSGVLTFAYVMVNLDTVGAVSPINLLLRLFMIWFLAFMVNYVAEHIRRSESRLLKLFNTLNKRTSELEKIQVQLEMVYDNSRTLAGILDFDQIINEILKIGERVLDYPALGIMLVGPGENLIYRGRLIGGQKATRLKAVSRGAFELAYRVAHEGEPVRVVNITGRTDYQPLLKSAKSVMLVPMVTYGKTTGLLTAESPRKGAFSDQDERFLAVLARSAAMALENSILHRKTEELTIIDELTGVHNYRYFSEKIKEEKKRAVRYDQALSLIMLDIDWFKKFNDNYGHEVGNHVLVGLIGVIRHCVRDVDILCRYGGEEFIIILPNTAERETMRIAERIREEVEAAEFGGGDGMPKLKVTVSVGISSFPENGLTEGELVNAVDQAMYRAKGSGKNTVCSV
ncbi:MAG: sensor domain-containing diguanylate cyclase [FCB group bacterium]|nr:sensor domain-containing diguanylate cyclase [FCB group bacterium]